ncbi:MAG: pyridoxal-phosphate dependent enzyme, partial [Deltaproteobacteria bacterium]|nr:pyridoxal-phosphate dependent enzyme [Deltaproteobacteria bacterium]
EKNMDLEYRGYGTIFAEIIRAVPDLTALAVPVSNGVTLSGLYMQTILDQKLVRLVGGSCLSNPIVTSVKEGREYQKLNKLLQEETEINEPLINWHSFDGESAVRAIIQSGGFAESSTDEELLNLSNTLNSFLPVSTHPSGVAGLNAVLKNQGKFSYRDIVVALVTSKNYSS